MLGPGGEFVGVEGDFGLEGFDCFEGFVEEDLMGRGEVSVRFSCYVR